jgi:hypothetical protein
MAPQRITNSLILIQLKKHTFLKDISPTCNELSGRWNVFDAETVKGAIRSAHAEFPAPLLGLLDDKNRNHCLPTSSTKYKRSNLVAIELVQAPTSDLDLGPLLLLHFVGTATAGVTSFEKFVSLGETALIQFETWGIKREFIQEDARAVVLTTLPEKKSTVHELIHLANVSPLIFQTAVTEIAIVLAFQNIASSQLRRLVPINLKNGKQIRKFVSAVEEVQNVFWWNHLAVRQNLNEVSDSFNIKFKTFNQLNELFMLGNVLRESERLRSSQNLNFGAAILATSSLVVGWGSFAFSDNRPDVTLTGLVATGLVSVAVVLIRTFR